MASCTINIVVYETRIPGSRHKYRWRAKGLNGEKMANGGGGYINYSDLVHALQVLWPSGSNSHVRVTRRGHSAPLNDAYALT